MTLYATWEEFAKDAEMLYSKDPMRVGSGLASLFTCFQFRLVTKYRHKDQKLVVKASDNQNVDTILLLLFLDAQICCRIGPRRQEI